MNYIKSSGALTEKISWLFLEWRRFLQKRLLNYEITIQQLSLLSQLNKKEYLLPNEIASWLHCDRPTASVIIKNLEKKKFVNRKKDENNAKYSKIILTESGKKFLEDVHSTLPPLEVNPFDVLTSEESEMLFSLLKKCSERMKEIINENEKIKGE